MNIVSYLNDPYSIEQTLKHLIKLFSQNTRALKEQICSRQILTLRFGEMDANGAFIELKLPRSFRNKFAATKTLSSELLFFDVLAQQGSYDQRLSDLTHAITRYNRHHAPLRSDTNTFFGTNISVPMAVRNIHYIPALIHFLSSTETNTELNISDELDRVFQSHGWRIETLDLLAARATVLKGQYGHTHIETLLMDSHLKHALTNELLENTLLEKLTEYALLNYANHQGQLTPQRVINDALAPFNGLPSRFTKKTQRLSSYFVKHFPNYQLCNHRFFE